MSTETPYRPGLSALLDDPSGQFLSTKWPHSSHVVHGDLSRLAGLGDISALGDPEQLFRVPCDLLRAELPSLEGKHQSLRADAESAPVLYQGGATIYLLNLSLPSFHAWTEAFEHELFLPPGSIQFNAFASRRGPGLKAHYDPQDNFMIQVRGAKRWRIARNEHVQFPSTNYGIGDPISPQTAAEAPHGFPTEMPAHKETIELREGSVLFVPRGYWHETQTTGEDSIHLVIEVRIPTWVQLLNYLLTEGGMATTEWREPVLGLWRNGPARPDLGEQLSKRFEILLGRLSEMTGAQKGK